MDAALFERLLYRGESETLDFKVDQYSFAGGTDDEKSEFLKDVLAFANAWREETAHILIGVQEVHGRATVMGISLHLNDHELQQFVNTKTQRPIKFSYEPFLLNGNQCGIISIPVQQRPFYLLKKFGRLEPNQVYLRRGSSTGIASPDEIAEMGRKQFLIQVPVFKIVATTQFHSQLSTADFRLVAKVINQGAATAYNVTVVLDRSSRHFQRFSTSVWQAKPHPEGLALITHQPIHPGSEQTIAVWPLGKASVPEQILSQLATGKKLPLEAIGATYGGGEVLMRLKLLATDRPASTFQLVFSEAEVATCERKEFSPIAG